MKYIETKRALRKAILLSPLVKFWHVVVERHDKSGTMFFGRGWEKFVEAHRLVDGTMVAFRYEGNLVFTVKIFLSNGCRARYSNTASVPSRALHEQSATSSSSCVRSDSAGIRIIMKFPSLLPESSLTSFRFWDTNDRNKEDQSARDRRTRRIAKCKGIQPDERVDSQMGSGSYISSPFLRKACEYLLSIYLSLDVRFE